MCILCILTILTLGMQDVTVAAKPVGTKKKVWQGHYCCVPLCYNVTILLVVTRNGINWPAQNIILFFPR